MVNAAGHVSRLRHHKEIPITPENLYTYAVSEPVCTEGDVKHG